MDDDVVASNLEKSLQLSSGLFLSCNSSQKFFLLWVIQIQKIAFRVLKKVDFSICFCFAIIAFFLVAFRSKTSYFSFVWCNYKTLSFYLY